MENGISGAAHERLRPHGLAHEVVSIQRDVERAGGNFKAGDLAQGARESPRQVDAPRTHAHNREILDASVSFDHFVGDAGEGAADPVRIHDDRHLVNRSRWVGKDPQRAFERALRAATSQQPARISNGVP